MKFDVVVGNPPYQENNENRNRDDSIYPYFYDSARMIADKYCLITPGRFLFGVGSTSSKWNKMMLNDKHIKVAYFNQNSEKVFPNTDIKGGVAILYRDETKNFGAIETFTPYDELNKILKKVFPRKVDKKEEFGELMHVQTKFNLLKLYEDFPEFENRLGNNGSEKRLISSIFTVLPEIFTDEPKTEQDVQIYGRKNGQRTYLWVDANYLEKDGNFNNYKVFVPAANGSGAIGEVLSTPVIGQPVIGQPVIGHTQTFISIGNFKSKYEAESLLKYLKSKFARAMLGIKKTTQNNKTKETWSTVPIQDFSPTSDIDWSQSVAEVDQQLYQKYGLSKEEIDFIESKVKEME